MALLALVTLAVGCGTDGSTASDPTTVGTADAAGVATSPAPTTSTTTTTTTTTTTAAQVAGSPLPPGSATAYVLGDSVILGAQSTVPAALAGWSVTFDAAENRRIDQGTSIVQGAGGAVGRVVVVHLCTNWGGGDYRAAAEGLLGSLRGADRVVWVTCTPWLPAVEDANAAIRALPETHAEVVVADWAAVSSSPGYTYGDGLHLQAAGASALATLVADAVGPAPAPA